MSDGAGSLIESVWFQSPFPFHYQPCCSKLVLAMSPWPGCWWDSCQSHRKECVCRSAHMPGQVHFHNKTPKQNKTLMIATRQHHLKRPTLKLNGDASKYLKLNPYGPTLSIQIISHDLPECLHSCQRFSLLSPSIPSLQLSSLPNSEPTFRGLLPAQAPLPHPALQPSLSLSLAELLLP